MVRKVGRLKRAILALLGIAFLVLSSGCAMIQERQEEERLLQDVKRDRLKSELYDAGEDFYRQGKLEEAQTEFRKMVEHFPDSIIAHYRLGNIAFRLRNLDNAAYHFEKVVELKPRHSKAHYNLALIRLLQSEEHLKFYTATVNPEADVSAISDFLGDINDFSQALNRKPSDKTDELDDIVGVIDKRN
ncbi:MAG: tetratricopeptide repeat protein [Ketobacteraceae bacterium]|nr:tetratricopeptide repeat protein [Ketobacteraceae bacterium]